MTTTTTATTGLCKRAPRILDLPGRSTFLAKFADDGYRCPGHPAWVPMRQVTYCGNLADAIREIVGLPPLRCLRPA